MSDTSPTPPTPPAPPEGDGGSPDEGKTFTQADVDRIVQDRLTRERSKFADYDNLKTKASEFDKLQSEQMSELEKAQERAAAAEKAKTEAEIEARQARTEAAVIAVAAGKVVDPDAAFRLIDPSQITYGDDGKPTNVTELLDQLIEDKPWLKPGLPPVAGEKPAGQGARGGEVIGREQLKTMTSEEIVKARQEGRLDHLLGAKP